MRNLIADVEKLENLQTVDAVWQGLLEVLHDLGCSHAIYLTVDANFENPFMRTTLPHFEREVPPADDPFLHHCCKRYDISPTGSAFLKDHAYLESREKSFIEGAGKLGFRTGLGIPMRLEGSTRFGGFNIGFDMDKETFLETIWPHAEDFRIFCLIIHRRIEELSAQQSSPAEIAGGDTKHVTQPELPEQFDALSPREREVIYLLATGASRKETAQICGISLNTVSEYAKGAYRKLGVHNAAQAASLIFGASANFPMPRN